MASKEQYKKRKVALKGIKNACIKSKERLYLANSKDLIRLIKQFYLLELYPELKELLLVHREFASN